MLNIFFSLHNFLSFKLHLAILHLAIFSFIVYFLCVVLYYFILEWVKGYRYCILGLMLESKNPKRIPNYQNLPSELQFGLTYIVSRVIDSS